MAETTIDVNRVLAKLQQKLNEATTTIIVLETHVEQLQEELEKYKVNEKDLKQDIDTIVDRELFHKD